MIRRPRRSLPATIVALVMLAVCVLVVVAVVQSLLGRTPFITLSALLGVTSSQSWSSAGTVAVAIVLAVLGLILLVIALRPGTPTVLPLRALVDDDDGSRGADAGVRRNTLTKDLATTAGAVPGVTSADVSARLGRITATVTVAAADPAAVPAEVQTRLETRIVEIGPAARPRVRVRARADKNT
ncbi:DUF6286 domain-containing protein [Actinomycetospora sp. NBRC 106378]|uniref:DUF6286 domain-containing protein n=1 Tax=Actinomycetospora sp. NBRC 106378 TaxID=3032208 RepID=UPI0024A3A73C|nr:DUF6286 domain-containing protein [Actinomycetospora sp. NBRC 106378]GLZ53488.1 hypothetical protein Acsp07_31050 [Actinomycetospora sp. NBRC 106378]